MKADKLLKNKHLIFLNKIFRLFGYSIFIECDADTMIVSKINIDKIYQ